MLKFFLPPPARHNHLRDIYAEVCHDIHLPVKIEVGYVLRRDCVNSQSANVLVQGTGTEENLLPLMSQSNHPLAMSP